MFQLNDKVQAIDDDYEGVITSINGSEISVRGKDGFIMPFRESELVPVINRELHRQITDVPLAAIHEKKSTKPSKSTRLPHKMRNLPTFEVDLHLHKLTSSERDMTNHDKLNLQVDTARRQLEFAISKRMRKMVFIHGVGEGVLREELYTLLRRYEGVDFYDADFQKYGAGATEVYLYQNAGS